MNQEKNMSNSTLLNNENKSIKEIIFNINTWIKYIFSKRNFIFKGLLLGLILGILVIFFQIPNYKAVLTFAMEEDKGVGGGLSGSSAAGLASQIGIDLGGAGGSAFSANNLMELMKSKLLIEKTLLDTIIINNKITTLGDYYAEVEGLRMKWNKNPNLIGINFLSSKDTKNFTLKQDSLLKTMYKRILSNNIVVQPKDKKVTIMYLEITSRNELFAKYFCENLAKETSDYYIETKTKKARTNVEILQRQVDSLRFNLNNAITGVAIAADRVYNLNPAFNIQGSTSKKRQVEVQANTVILTQLLAQLELAKVNLRKETPLIQLIDKPKLPLDDDRYIPYIVLILFSLTSVVISSFYLILNKILKEN